MTAWDLMLSTDTVWNLLYRYGLNQKRAVHRYQSMFETTEKDRVVDSVKCSREVEKCEK